MRLLKIQGIQKEEFQIYSYLIFHKPFARQTMKG